MVATRRLAPGAIILIETPLLAANTTNNLLEDATEVLKLFGLLSNDQKTKVLDLFDPREDYHRLEIMEVLKSTLGLEEESLKVMRIFFINAVDVRFFGLDCDASALYQNLSRINHSCAPNCVWSGKKENIYVKEIRAVRKIEKGTEIVACYFDNDEFISRNERRELLKKNWNFHCNCEICDLKEEELKENEKVWSKIRNHHENVAYLGRRGDVIGALANAEKKLDLMLTIKDEVILNLPTALLEVENDYSVAKKKKKWKRQK